MSKMQYRKENHRSIGRSTALRPVLSTIFLIVSASLITGCSDPGDAGPSETINKYIEAMRACDPAQLDKLRAPQSLVSNPVSPAQSLAWQQSCLAAAPMTLTKDAPLLISLKMASEMKPELRNSGKLAVYDLSGMGTGIREMRFVLISGNWYLLNSW